MTPDNTNVVFRGYTKQEQGQWVAVCIDLNIVAQGDTPDEAKEECRELILAYLKYIAEKHSNELAKYIPRLAPREMIDEYNSIVSRLIVKQDMRRARKNLLNFNYGPYGLMECRI